MKVETTRLIDLTLGDIMPLIVQAIKEQLSELVSREESLPSTIKGKREICRYLKCDSHIITELVKHNTLGYALWKKETKNGNAPIYFDREKGEARFRYFQRQPENVQKAWLNFTGDMAESEWFRLGL